MSLYVVILIKVGFSQKIALLPALCPGTIALPIIAKADVISTQRIGRSSSLT